MGYELLGGIFLEYKESLLTHVETLGHAVDEIFKMSK